MVEQAERIWRVVRYPAAVGLLVYAVLVQWPDVSAAGQLLGHLNWAWVGLAVFAQYGSIGFTGRLQRRLLASGGVELSRGSSIALVYAGSAYSMSFLGSGWLSRSFTYGKLRARGADQILASWVLVVSAIASSAALVAVAVVGAAAADAGGTATTVLVSIGLVAALIGVSVVARHRDHLLRLARWLVVRCQRITGKPAGDPDILVTDAGRRLGEIHTGKADLALITVAAVGIWVTDLFCLATSFRAIGSHAPWPGVIVAYTAGQLARTVPFLPGGLGLVEGAMAATCVAYGVARPTALAAILIHRLISYWGVLAVGAIIWWRQHRTHPDQDRAAGPDS